MQLVAAIVFSLIALGGMWACTKKFIPAWNERGFGDRGLNWQTVTVTSLAGGAVAATAGFLLSGQWYIAAILAVFAYFTVLATWTDLSVLKIPSEISIISYLVLVPIPLLWANQIDVLGWMSVGFWGAICLMMLFFSKKKKGLGMADVRIMFLAFTGLSWWVGMILMNYALLLACAVQIALFIITANTNFGVTKRLDDAVVVNKETNKLEGKAQDEPVKYKATMLDRVLFPVKKKLGILEENDTLSDSVEKKKNKKKRHTPFGPALLASFLIISFYALATQDVPDLTWSNSVLTSFLQ